MKYNEFVHAICKPLPPKEHWDHAFIGMLGEIGEITDAIKRHIIYERPLDEDNILEELGDFRYYLEMVVPEVLRSDISVDPEELPRTGRFIQLEGCESEIFFVSEVLKATDDLFPTSLCKVMLQLYDDHTPDSAKEVWKEYEKLRNKFGYSEQEVLDSNVQKLSIRYPSLSFSTKDAVERKDKL